MTARELVAALKGRWHGGYGTARCPAHNDNQPSLSVTASDGRILVKCHADCPQDAVIDALRRLGLWGSQAEGRETKRRDHEDRREVDDVKRSAAALAIWRAAAPIAGTLAERYLVTRGIEPPHPPSLRYHPGLRYHDQDGPGALILPALVAGIQWPDRRLGAIQRTFLDPRGDRKAQVSCPRKTLGPFNGGALRLGPAGPELGIAEGCETGVSAMRMSEVPVWCVCGARLAAIDLPPVVKTVHVFADNGTPGKDAAERAADRYTHEGRRVELRYPPPPIGDWNDVISAEAVA